MNAEHWHTLTIRFATDGSIDPRGLHPQIVALDAIRTMFEGRMSNRVVVDDVMLTHDLPAESTPRSVLLSAPGAVDAPAEAKDVTPTSCSAGDGLCQECGHQYRSWFTDNPLWNEVMGGSAYGGDPGGFLCPTCFAVRAEAVFPGIAWRFIPEWSGRSTPMDWPTADGRQS